MNRKADFLSCISFLNPEQVAPIAIEKMLKGKEVIIPGFVNQVSLLLDKLLPAFVKNIFTERLMKRLNPVNIPTVQIHKDSSPMAA
jgi:short-subunit dehydrogenase